MIDRCMLQCAAWLTPPEDREEWLAEWTSELWYVSERSKWEAVRFCLGAFKDAFWLRRNATKPDLRPMCWFRSPAQCLAFLAAFAAVSAFFAFRWPVPTGIMQRAMLYRDILFADIGTILFAIAILPATTRLALGEYPVTVHSPSRAKRLGRWIFFFVKLVLIIPAVFFGTLDLAQILCLYSGIPLGFGGSTATLPGLPALAGQSHAHRPSVTDVAGVVWDGVRVRSGPRFVACPRDSDDLVSDAALAVFGSVVA